MRVARTLATAEGPGALRSSSIYHTGRGAHAPSRVIVGTSPTDSAPARAIDVGKPQVHACGEAPQAAREARALPGKASEIFGSCSPIGTLGHRAFTLIEFILVMALLAIVIAVIAPSLSNFFRGRKLDSEARRFVALARYGQSRAASDGVPMILWMDRQAGTYGLREQDGFSLDTLQVESERSRMRKEFQKVDTQEPTFHLAQNLRFELEGVNSRTNGRLVTIRFLPDGTIDEAALRVLQLLQEDPEKRRETETLWIAQSLDNTRYEIVDKTNAWQRLSLETSLQGGLYTR